MLERLLIFGAGYLLGTRAGRERFDELAAMAKQLAARDEVKMLLSIAGGFLEDRFGGVVSTQERRAA